MSLMCVNGIGRTARGVSGTADQSFGLFMKNLKTNLACVGKVMKIGREKEFLVCS